MTRFCVRIAHAFLPVVFVLSSMSPVAAASQQPGRPLQVIVTDENGVSVAAARVVLERSGTGATLIRETDFSGRCDFAELEPGSYTLRVEKEGFYAVDLADLRVGDVADVEITLNHQQGFAETMDVVYSPPAIDPAETASSEILTSREIIHLPYSTSRDIRNLLPFIPGVVQGVSGNVHVNGSAADQVLSQLDGFNVTHPTTGLFDIRVSVDALRTVEVQSSRYSAEFGKGSGGLLALATAMGDDRYRLSATNFIPSLQNARGVTIDNWTPRATFSGPIRKKRSWFINATDAEYNIDVVKELPAGADRSHALRLSNLSKLQFNLTASNILTAGLLVNDFRADHVGLTRFNPLETTRKATRAAYLLTVKDQAYLSNGVLLELGAAVNRFRVDERPLGTRAFFASPGATSGNHFETAESDSRRVQGVVNLFLPAMQWRGRHELRMGIDIDFVAYDQLIERRQITLLRDVGTRARQISFGPADRFGRDNFESSLYIQDRWSASNRVLLELGARLDWDTILRRLVTSPRFASSFLVTRDGETKISGGAGLFRDATNLEVVARPLFGRRFDTLFAEDGSTADKVLGTAFHVDERNLVVPRYVNLSISLERRLPASFHLNVEFIWKRTDSGFAFVNRDGRGGATGELDLRNARHDRYHSFQVTLRKMSRGSYGFLASYVRSSARSDTLFDFSFDNPVLHQPATGPMSWDVPNRFISWGWLPVVKKFDLIYAVEWRDGYAFNVVDENQELVGPPHSRRFPVFFSLNLHAERRFRLIGSHWGLRAGFNNVTNRRNASSVNNNIDSPGFLTFGSFQDRAFTGRIRWIRR